VDIFLISRSMSSSSVISQLTMERVTRGKMLLAMRETGVAVALLCSFAPNVGILRICSRGVAGVYGPWGIYIVYTHKISPSKVFVW